jgi:hypothetical protein
MRARFRLKVPIDPPRGSIKRTSSSVKRRGEPPVQGRTFGGVSVSFGLRDKSPGILSALVAGREDLIVIKSEKLPNDRTKVILKDLFTGSVTKRIE